MATPRWRRRAAPESHPFFTSNLHCSGGQGGAIRVLIQLNIPLRYRTIWISDLHLGTRRAQADMLIAFLRVTESETLYLVGDIVDNWALKKSWFWEQSHNDVIQKLLRKARKGTRVVFIPGNHDEYFRDFARLRFGNVS
jgi:metallophosphoesterase superfamily enzyme